MTSGSYFMQAEVPWVPQPIFGSSRLQARTPHIGTFPTLLVSVIRIWVIPIDYRLRYSWLPAVRPRISQTVRLFGSSPCQCISLFFHFVHMGKVCSKFTPRRDIKVLAMTYIVQENPNIHELIRLIVGFHDLHDDKVCLQPVTIDRGCLRLKTVFLAL